MEGREAVDILYVIGTGSLNNNAELRYSLRTLSRHCRNVGRVIISGDVPDFVGGCATTVPCHDISVSGKHWNMLHKIAMGIKGAGLTRPFLISCDDHFFTRDTDIAKWPRRMRREHIYTEQEWNAEHGRAPGKYQRAVAATGQLLRSHGLPDMDTVWHGNMWIDPKYLDEVMDLANSESSKSIYGFEPMMLFEAMHRRDNPESPVVKLPADVKAKTFNECMSFASAYGYFSTSDRAWMNGELLKWFQKNYPYKSEWEK